MSVCYVMNSMSVCYVIERTVYACMLCDRDTAYVCMLCVVCRCPYTCQCVCRCRYVPFGVGMTGKGEGKPEVYVQIVCVRAKGCFFLNTCMGVVFVCSQSKKDAHVCVCVCVCERCACVCACVCDLFRESDGAFVLILFSTAPYMSSTHTSLLLSAWILA